MLIILLVPEGKCLMKTEFEKIFYPHTYYNLFITNLVYCVPHLHKEYELCLLLDGEVSIRTDTDFTLMKTGDIWLINPFQRHELNARKPAQILCLQFPSSFFSKYFPQINQLRFLFTRLRSCDQKYAPLCTQFLLLGQKTFAREDFFELKCASLINYIFVLILDAFSWYITSAQNHNYQSVKSERCQIIQQYIEEHYQQKLLLSDLSSYLELSLNYLSHFFKDNFGMAFQDYLANFRCEKARILLLTSNLTLLDISLSCGFSDPKYFKKHFLRQFGCTPKQYKTSFQKRPLPLQQKNILTTQNILSPASSLLILDKYAERESITWH